ncbi:hypothetical protein CDAR_424291 [Caerostris darwini]|uniref:Uncharacterized protein n=1 Tax=Caerostris darwini TaxID=1538125 RepID=A0AAV4T3V0_9ARAC|nr:hypothetical protein CDAR_424291 [Caerostris darwini]
MQMSGFKEKSINTVGQHLRIALAMICLILGSCNYRIFRFKGRKAPHLSCHGLEKMLVRSTPQLTDGITKFPPQFRQNLSACSNGGFFRGITRKLRPMTPSGATPSDDFADDYILAFPPFEFKSCPR